MYEKEFTSGQIAGAVKQLADSGDLIKVERGLYRGKMVQKENRSEQEEIRAEVEGSEFQKRIKDFLVKAQKDLVEAVNAGNILEMSKEDYILLDEMKKLKQEIERIEKGCR